MRSVVLISELDVKKTENIVLTVAKYIVEKRLLRNVTEKIRTLEGV